MPPKKERAIALYEKVTGRKAPDHYLIELPEWMWLPAYDGLAIGRFIFSRPVYFDLADYCHELEHVRQWQNWGPRMWWQWIRHGFTERNPLERAAYKVEGKARQLIYYGGFNVTS